MFRNSKRSVSTLALLLAVTLLALPAAAEERKGKKKKKNRTQTAETTEQAPATDPAAPQPAPRNPEAERLDKLLRAWDTEGARKLLEGLPAVDDPSLIAARGRLHEQDGDYAAAAADLETAASKAAADPAPLLYLGEAQLHAGRPAEADDAFRRAADRAKKLADQSPKDPTALYQLGVAQQRTRRFDEAVATLEKARELEPDDAMIVYQLGVTRAFQERWTEAVDLLGKAIQLDSGIAYAYYYRGLAASKAGRKDLLLNDLDRFLVMAPNAPEAPTARRILDSI